MKENLINRKLMIYFTAGVDDDGKIINKTKTFNAIRLDSEESDLAIFADKYRVLSNHMYKKTVAADYFEISLADTLQSLSTKQKFRGNFRWLQNHLF